MSDLLSLIARHGYLTLAVVVFLEAVGIPIPAAVALVAAGAAAAGGVLRLDVALAVAVGAMVAGDLLLFYLGRKMGWTLLALLCRLAANPETCILRSAESFYRRGRVTLVIAKFVPGINTMAPPLAGSMKMRLGQFLALDTAGALVYSLAFGLVGYLAGVFLKPVVRGLSAASHTAGWLALAGVAVYAAYHLYLLWKHRVYRVVPRVQVEELAGRMNGGEEGARILVADVRSHGYYDAGAMRIPGSMRLEPNHLLEAIKELPRDRDIYLYCT